MNIESQLGQVGLLSDGVESVDQYGGGLFLVKAGFAIATLADRGQVQPSSGQGPTKTISTFCPGGHPPPHQVGVRQREKAHLWPQ